MRLHWSGSAIVLGVTLVLAAGCGKKQQQAETAAATEQAAPSATEAAAPVQAPAAGVDPCSLLTVDDIKSVVNKPVTAGKVNASDASMCDYEVGGGDLVSVAAKIASAGETIDKVMTAAQKHGKVGEKLSAPGDGSFFFDAGMNMVQLNTFRGNKYVIITSLLTGTPEPQVKEIVTKLMEKAVSKI